MMHLQIFNGKGGFSGCGAAEAAKDHFSAQNALIATSIARI
jgi:hypothetical protein